MVDISRPMGDINRVIVDINSNKASIRPGQKYKVAMANNALGINSNGAIAPPMDKRDGVRSLPVKVSRRANVKYASIGPN